LARGDVLTLAGLERRFGVSRTVVREAMRILESLGMVHAKRRVGLTVQPSSSWSLLDPQVIAWRLAGSDRAQQLRSLTQLRVALEPVAARLAAAGDSDAGARLVPLARRLRELGEAGQGASAEDLAADIEFHSLLVRFGGIGLCPALAGTVAECLSARPRLAMPPARPAAGPLPDHEGLAEAVVAGDAVSAEDHARSMVESVWAEIARLADTGPAGRD